MINCLFAPKWDVRMGIGYNWCNKIRMLPSMRYETKKLTELYHMRKSFQDHKKSVEKIKKKPNQSTLGRSRDLEQRRSRMHYAFNYTQYVRAKQISKDNLLLFRKCTEDRRSNISVRSEKKPMQVDYRGGARLTPRAREISAEDGSQREDYLLVSHRNSPINKMTSFERGRENLRLAIKIAKPCAVINTKKLQKIHEEAKRHRERIMRYDSISLKSAKYLDKKISNRSFRSHKLSGSFDKLSSTDNPQSHQKKNTGRKQGPVFRSKHGNNKHGTFSLTDHQF